MFLAMSYDTDAVRDFVRTILARRLANSTTCACAGEPWKTRPACGRGPADIKQHYACDLVLLADPCNLIEAASSLPSFVNNES